MENSKRGTIPMKEKLKFSKSQGASTPAEIQRMQNILYASANPGDAHWTTVKNILKYLRNTKDMFLVNGAIAIAKDHGVTKGARHFHAKVHYLRETIEIGYVRIEKVDTDDNPADPIGKIDCNRLNTGSITVKSGSNS
ncbi:hypothetical protein Tco_0867497 [Tanacetum coccineum]